MQFNVERNDQSVADIIPDLPTQRSFFFKALDAIRNDPFLPLEILV
jgi:hypothetical protein